MKTKLSKCRCGATFEARDGKAECDGCTYKKINDKDKDKNKFDVRVLT